MRRLEGWFRESRTLVAIDAMTHTSGDARVSDVVLVDFIAQHPLLFERFLPSETQPTASQPLSEDFWLRWKRSAALQVAAPFIARLISRNLVTRVSGGRLATTLSAAEILPGLVSILPPGEVTRVRYLAQTVGADPESALERLALALTEVDR